MNMKYTGLRTKPLEESVVLDETRGLNRLVEFQPGNGTRYLLMITDLEPFSDEACGRIGTSPNSKLVSLITDPAHQRSVVIGGSEVIHFTRMERLSESRPDQVVLAEFLGWILNMEACSCEEYLRDFG